jgi:hypothetical protein
VESTNGTIVAPLEWSVYDHYHHFFGELHPIIIAIPYSPKWNVVWIVIYSTKFELISSYGYNYSSTTMDIFVNQTIGCVSPWSIGTSSIPLPLGSFF